MMSGEDSDLLFASGQRARLETKGCGLLVRSAEFGIEVVCGNIALFNLNFFGQPEFEHTSRSEYVLCHQTPRSDLFQAAAIDSDCSALLQPGNFQGFLPKRIKRSSQSDLSLFHLQ